MKQTKPSKSKCDKLWGELIRRRDKRCRLCGKTENLQAHHIARKKSYRLRYCLDNGITLCPGCHLGGVHCPDYQTAKYHLEKIALVVGQLHLDALELMKSDTTKYSLSEAWNDLKLAEASMASKGGRYA